MPLALFAADGLRSRGSRTSQQHRRCVTAEREARDQVFYRRERALERLLSTASGREALSTQSIKILVKTLILQRFLKSLGRRRRCSIACQGGRCRFARERSRVLGYFLKSSEENLRALGHP